MVLAMAMPMTVERWTNSQKNLKAIADSIAVVRIEPFRPEIEGRLAAQADVDLFAVGEVADITGGQRVHGKEFSVIALIQDQFVPGFFHQLPAAVNGVSFALIIGLEQE